MARMDFLDWATLALVIIGALNWGLVGLGLLMGQPQDAYNLVDLIFGAVGESFVAFIYLLVGLSGLYQIYFGYELYEDERV